MDLTISLKGVFPAVKSRNSSMKFFSSARRLLFCKSKAYKGRPFAELSRLITSQGVSTFSSSQVTATDFLGKAICKVWHRLRIVGRSAAGISEHRNINVFSEGSSNVFSKAFEADVFK